MAAENPVVVRASSLPTVLDCTRRWAARTLREEIEAAGFALRNVGLHVGAPIGTGTHASAAHMLRGKRDTGRPAPFHEAEELGMVELDRALEEAGEVMWDKTAANRNDAQRQVRRLSMKYLEQVVPGASPVLVEERLVAEVEPGFIVSGQLDSLGTYAPDHGLDDTKTGTEPRGAVSQQGCYSLLLRTPRPEFPDGWKVSRLGIHWLPRRSLNVVQPDVVRGTIDQNAAENLAQDAITSAIDAVKKFRVDQDPSAFRANPGSMLCSDRFCPAWGTAFCRARVLFEKLAP